MIDPSELAARYVGIWNEPDAMRRRRRIAELWAEDGRHFTRTLEARGHEALETRVATAYEKWVKEGGYVFAPLGSASGHHDVVRLGWQMRPAAGGAAVSVGAAFLLVGDDGRIRVDYQFTDPSPA